MLLERIDQLIKMNSSSRAELERLLEFGHGSIRNWDKSMPSVDKIQKIADHFDVSVDYLLGRTNKPNYIKTMNEDTVIQELEQLIFYLSDNDAPTLVNDKLEIGKETHDLLIMSLEQSLRLARVEEKIKNGSQEKLI